MIPADSDQRYYSKLPDLFRKWFDERYTTKSHLYDRHKKDFETFSESQFFYDANRLYAEYTLKGFPHEEFMNQEMKRKIDDSYSHVIEYQNGDQRLYVIIFWQRCYTWPNNERVWLINHIVFHDASDYVCYSMANWKNIGGLMRQSQTISLGIGNGYAKDSQIYDHSQIIQHPETITLLKSIDKLKYLPIEKFTHINYFHLLNATPEMLYSYELLLKMGATRVASGALLDRKLITKSMFQETRKLLMKNPSYKRWSDTWKSFEEAIRQRLERMELKDLEKELKAKKRIIIEDESLLLVSPRSIKEMQHESNVLNHCLGKSGLRRYTERIITGNCTILFARKKEQPDIPYYTVELQGTHITQCRTTSNISSQEVTKEIKNIIQKHYEVFANA